MSDSYILTNSIHLVCTAYALYVTPTVLGYNLHCCNTCTYIYTCTILLNRRELLLYTQMYRILCVPYALHCIITPTVFGYNLDCCNIYLHTRMYVCVSIRVHPSHHSTGEQIQENAHVIMRLLIHHPECLGPALAGEAIGLQRVYEEALDHMLNTPVFGSSRASPRDSTDLGSATPLKGTLSRGETIVYSESSPHGERHRSNSYMNLNLMSTRLVLSFYTSLVRLLAYCAPIKVSVNKSSNGNGSDVSNEVPGLSDLNSTASGGQSGGDDAISGSEGGHSGSGTTSGTCSTKVNGDEWTRNILSNLISMEDVKGILSLPFAHDGHGGIVPTHKEAVLLFLSHVYGLSDRQLLCDLLTDAFLPDIKTALKLPSVSPVTHYISDPCSSLGQSMRQGWY